MIEQYKEELRLLKLKMKGAEEFAKKLPVFKDIILKRKLQSSFTGAITNYYKEISFNWGINRYLYRDSGKNITNFEGYVEDIYLFNIYINTLTMYSTHNKYGLSELKNKCFFFDEMNTTFYAKDEEIEGLLDSLNEWYLKAIVKVKEDKQREDLEKAKRIIELYEER